MLERLQNRLYSRFSYFTVVFLFFLVPNAHLVECLLRFCVSLEFFVTLKHIWFKHYCLQSATQLRGKENKAFEASFFDLQDYNPLYAVECAKRWQKCLKEAGESMMYYVDMFQCENVLKAMMLPKISVWNRLQRALWFTGGVPCTGFIWKVSNEAITSIYIMMQSITIAVNWSSLETKQRHVFLSAFRELLRRIHLMIEMFDYFFSFVPTLS